MEGEADPEPVDQAVDREAGRAERADPMVRPGLVRLVAVMKDEDALSHEEEEEAGADDRERVSRIVQRPKRLRKDVEEGDRDDDAAGERDQRRQLPTQAQREETAKGIAIHVTPRRSRRE